MTDIYLESLTYDKQEIDTKFVEERVYTDAEVFKKLDLNQKGSPSGVASLNVDGDVSNEQLPIATNAESSDDTENTKLMTPELTHYVLDTGEYIQKPQADQDYGDLESDGSVQMGAAYNPQVAKDIATVEFVMSAVAGSSRTYVVNTQVEMFALIDIKVGDTCFVTSELDPLDNGEFVAKIDDPVDIDDWAERQTKTAWGAIIGTLSDQTDLDNRFTTNESAIATNTAKETNTVTNLGVTYSATEVGITSSDGDNIIIDPVDATDAGVMTSADKAILDTLNAPQTGYVATGSIPSVKLEVEDGGTVGLFQIYDMASPVHLVSGIQWVKATQETDWTLSDKDTGVTKAMFQMKPDGTFHIGDGMVQSQIATVDDLDDAVDKTQYNDMTGSAPVNAPGQIYYANNTLNLGSDYGTLLQLGQELYTEVINITGVTIPEGSLIYQTGVFNGLPSVGLARANTYVTAIVIGVTTMSIADGATGLATTFGNVNGLNTEGMATDVLVYLSDITPGGMTTVAPDIVTVVGSILRADLTAGVLGVRIRSNVALPTIFAGIKGATVPTSLPANLNTITEIVSYTGGIGVVMAFDPNAGTLFCANNGTYRANISFDLAFDNIGAGGKKEIYLGIRDITDDLLLEELKGFVLKDAETYSFSANSLVDLAAGNEYGLELRSEVALTNLTFSQANFDLESVHIR